MALHSPVDLPLSVGVAKSKSGIGKLRFLFIAPRFHSNQADLVRKLQEEGHSVDFLVVTSSKSEDHTRVKPRVLSATALGGWLDRTFNSQQDPGRRASLAFPRLPEIRAHLRETAPDVVVIRGTFAGGLPLPPPYVLMALPWLFSHGCTLVLYTQGAKLRFRPSARRRAFYILLLSVLRLRWFTTVERSNSKSPVSDIHPRMAFIPFFKYPELGALERTYSDAPRFLAVAKYSRRKNLASLVDAFAALDAPPTATLTIVGENTLAEHATVLEALQRQIAVLGLRSRVRLLENQTYDQVRELYRSHDVFVLPSYAEPASVSQIEAMANGMAVVCNQDNGTAHYVEDGSTGFIVDSGPKSIEIALRRYIAEPGLARQHGQAGLRRLCTEYSVDMAYRRLMGLIQQRSLWSGRDGGAR